MWPGHYGCFCSKGLSQGKLFGLAGHYWELQPLHSLCIVFSIQEEQEDVILFSAAGAVLIVPIARQLLLDPSLVLNFIGGHYDFYYLEESTSV